MNTEKESRSRVQLVPLGAELVITQLVCGCDWFEIIDVLVGRTRIF